MLAILLCGGMVDATAGSAALNQIFNLATENEGF